MVIEPEAGNPHEVEGILNPAATRGPDGHLYLFPRLVAKGNYSRIGIARVKFNAAGDPTAIERLGIALEPEAEYERRPDGGGGCEDPRISFVQPLQRYIMTYTAYSPRGPRDRSPPQDGFSTGNAWGLQPSLRITGSPSTTWTTRTPACFPSQSRTRQIIRNSLFCTGHCFPGHAPKNSLLACIAHVRS